MLKYILLLLMLQTPSQTWRIGPITRSGKQTVTLKNPPSQVEFVQCAYWDFGDSTDPNDDVVRNERVWHSYSKPHLTFTPGEAHTGNYCAAIGR